MHAKSLKEEFDIKTVLNSLISLAGLLLLLQLGYVMIFMIKFV